MREAEWRAIADRACDHNEIPVYRRPWRRLFRKEHCWVCIRCDRYRPRTPGAGNPDEDQP